MPENVINAFGGLLQWGPLGLAGLTLILVVFALMTSELTRLKAALLAFLMVIGVGFVGALLYFDNTAEHRVTLIVLPNDMDGSGFPPPVIKVNGTQHESGTPLMVAGATTLTVDVNRGLVAYQETNTRAQTAEAEVAEAQEQIAAADNAVAELRVEVDVKQEALTEANQTIAAQNASLIAAQQNGQALAAQVSQLQTQITSNPGVTVSPNQFQALERQLQQFNNNLATGIFR